MKSNKKVGFGLGSIFSLIVVYFIFFYSRDHNWTILAFITKWYLIIVGGLFALSIAVVILISLFTLTLVIMAYFKMRSFGKAQRERKNKERKYVDVDYKIKE